MTIEAIVYYEYLTVGKNGKKIWKKSKETIFVKTIEELKNWINAFRKKDFMRNVDVEIVGTK